MKNLLLGLMLLTAGAVVATPTTAASNVVETAKDAAAVVKKAGFLASAKAKVASYIPSTKQIKDAPAKVWTFAKNNKTKSLLIGSAVVAAGVLVWYLASKKNSKKNK